MGVTSEPLRPQPDRELKVPVMRLDGADTLPLPAYATEGAAGLDLCAAISEDIVLRRGQVVMVPTGLAFAIPKGFEGQVRPRSGLAAKHGVMVVNAPGTIDSDYRGEVAVLLTTILDTPFTISPGTRIAQIVFAPVVQAQLQLVETLEATARGAGGFGHTGTNAR